MIKKNDVVKSKIIIIKVILRLLKIMQYTTTRNVAAVWISSPLSTSAKMEYSETIQVNKEKCSKDSAKPNPTTKQPPSISPPNVEKWTTASGKMIVKRGWWDRKCTKNIWTRLGQIGKWGSNIWLSIWYSRIIIRNWEKRWTKNLLTRKKWCSIEIYWEKIWHWSIFEAFLHLNQINKS